MTKHLLMMAAIACSLNAMAEETVKSPDGKTIVTIDCANGRPTYSVTYDGRTVVLPSALGLTTSIGDFTKDMEITTGGRETGVYKKKYNSYRIKRFYNEYEANTLRVPFLQKGKECMSVEVQVSNNNVGFRYRLASGKPQAIVINSEATSYTLPDGTTTFLCPQMGTMTGFARTAPSYETHYEADQPMGKNGNGLGYTFPCLFKTADAGKTTWVLVSETGVDGTYCASRLESRSPNSYRLTFPSEGENNGWGSSSVQTQEGAYTPWRTITVGETLQPIVEGTVTWDLVGRRDNAYTRHIEDMRKEYGRGSWSWIIAGDGSCNYDTQRKYIDFSAEMGWESLLIDAMWDTQIGRDRIKQLADYGKSKGVALYLWYNSNGTWNDAPQTPRHCMDRSAARRAEMQWMRDTGIRGIKVDFFGGDKQTTMQLYEDILRDAEEFGLLVIFHGCTLPRGWEAMYQSYVSSEAVRASENLNFIQAECDNEATNATYLPFIRNAVGSMDFGGSTLNKYYSAGNNRGRQRKTSDVFALATAVLFQSPVQHFAMAPNNLTDAPAWAVDFMKSVPTVWQDTKFIEGYPGKYVVLARQDMEGRWYIVGVNGTKEPMKLKLSLPMLEQGQKVKIYNDLGGQQANIKEVGVGKKRELTVTMPVDGAFLAY